MKTTAKIIVMILVLGTGLCMKPQNAQAGMGYSYQVFYDELSPYGTWVDSPDYGYVWVPNVDPGFFPYATAGHWVYTDWGWMWISEYPWGWAPFHYGRWYYDNWYGWLWVPGNEWGPAWVSWRRCDGYFGWSPLAPGLRVGVEYGWNRYNLPPHHWCFVREHYFGRRDIARFYVDRRDNDRIYQRSTFIQNASTDRNTNIRFFSGPDVQTVHRVTGQVFRPMPVRDNQHPGQAINERDVKIYRPEIKQITDNGGRKPTPGKFVPYPTQPKRSEPVIRNDKALPVNNEAKKETPQYQNNGKGVRENNGIREQKREEQVNPVNNQGTIRHDNPQQRQIKGEQVRPSQQQKPGPRSSQPVKRSNEPQHKADKPQNPGKRDRVQ